jgi:hypothetical protein
VISATGASRASLRRFSPRHTSRRLTSSTVARAGASALLPISRKASFAIALNLRRVVLRHPLRRRSSDVPASTLFDQPPVATPHWRRHRSMCRSALLSHAVLGYCNIFYRSVRQGD